MKNIFIAASLLLSFGAFAQSSEKPSDVSATRQNTLRTKEVSEEEVKTKNITTAPTSGMIDKTVPERQKQGQTLETRVKPAIIPTSSKVDGEK